MARNTQREVASLGVEKALRFFSKLDACPFVCLILEDDMYHLFTKGTDEEVEELMTELRKEAASDS